MTTPTRSTARRWLELLRVRLALLGVVALLAAVGLTGAVLLQRAETDTLAERLALQHTEAERSVGMLAQRLKSQIEALAVIGHGMTPALVANPAALENLLRDRPLVLAQFDSVFVARADGQVQAFHDDRGFSRKTINLADRAYFQTAMREGRAVVSEPVIGRASVEPAVVVAQPLREGGRVVGIVAGALRLRRAHSPLAGLGVASSHASAHASAHASNHGGGTLVVVTDASGTIVAHPIPALVGRRVDAEPRLTTALAQWVAAGRPMRAEALSLSDAQAIGAVAGLPAAHWLLWRLQPRSEVLAPLAAARTHALWAGAGVVVALALLLLATLRWLLRPLRQLADRAERLFDEQMDAAAGWPQAGGEIGELAAVLRRVGAERRGLEHSRAHVLRQLQSVMGAAPLGILITRDRRFELVSQDACRQLGRSQAELLGQPAESIFVSTTDYQQLGPQVAEAFGRRAPFTGELRFQRADGQHYWGRLSGQPVDWGDAGAGTIWTLIDINDQVAAREQLEWAASHDALTGLANRSALQHRLARVVADTPRPAALLLLDLDHFKPVNDQHGHAAGDAVLRAVALAMAGCVRGADLVARLGGDEFAVVLADCPPDAAERVADTLRRSVRLLKVPWQGTLLGVGASIGVAARPEGCTDANVWLAAADAACYADKATGRGQQQVALRLA